MIYRCISPCFDLAARKHTNYRCTIRTLAAFSVARDGTFIHLLLGNIVGGVKYC